MYVGRDLTKEMTKENMVLQTAVYSNTWPVWQLIATISVCIMYITLGVVSIQWCEVEWELINCMCIHVYHFL